MNILKKIRRYFYKYYISKYLEGINPSLLTIINKPKIFEDDTIKRRKKILKKISSANYKKFFYNAVNYEINQSPPISKISKYKKIVSKLLIFLFYKNLHKQLSTFKQLSKKIVRLNNDADKYISNTTITERLDRAKLLKVISENQYNLYKRYFKIKKL